MKPSRRDLATRLLILDALGRAIREARKAVERDLAGSGMLDRIGLREVGEIGTRPLGRVEADDGDPEAWVTDERALMAWCRAKRPEWIQPTYARDASSVWRVVEVIGPDHLQRLLNEVRRLGSHRDPVTGEAVNVPGVELRAGSLRLTVKPSVEALQVISDAIEDGAMFLPAVLGLPMQRRAAS